MKITIKNELKRALFSLIVTALFIGPMLLGSEDKGKIIYGSTLCWVIMFALPMTLYYIAYTDDIETSTGTN